MWLAPLILLARDLLTERQLSEIWPDNTLEGWKTIIKTSAVLAGAEVRGDFDSMGRPELAVDTLHTGWCNVGTAEAETMTVVIPAMFGQRGSKL